jgi:hypothetical protein
MLVAKLDTNGKPRKIEIEINSRGTESCKNRAGIHFEI